MYENFSFLLQNLIVLIVTKGKKNKSLNHFHFSAAIKSNISNINNVISTVSTLSTLSADAKKNSSTETLWMINGERSLLNYIFYKFLRMIRRCLSRLMLINESGVVTGQVRHKKVANPLSFQPRYQTHMPHNISLFGRFVIRDFCDSNQ